jgi:hypothetical protein
MDTASTQRGTLTETVAAALMLAVGMGFGRFAYTGMYPLMVRDGLLTISGGSFAASANYAGYLAGALLLSRSPASSAASLCRIGLAGTVLCLALLALDLGPLAIAAIRFSAGILSAMLMVCASVWLFQVVGNMHGAPLLYAGVGIGILLSAELIAGGNVSSLHSRNAWLALAAAAGVLSLAAWHAVSSFQGNPRSAPPQPASAEAGDRLQPWALILVYGLAGFGYIVTATYLPLFVRNAVGQVDPVHIWAAFGLGAAPSCFFWHSLHVRLGTRRALALNLAVQAVGVVLPAASLSPLPCLLSALLVGGTFVGTVTIAMPAARRLATTVHFNIFATMTASYSMGQIVGPLLSNVLYRHSQSFDLPLLAAGAALTAGTAACLAGTSASMRKS